MDIEGFSFLHDFDSGNLGFVEFVGEHPETDDEEHYYEFDIWPRADNEGTPFQSTIRTWFYFGVKCQMVNPVLKLNINVTKGNKFRMYSHNFNPVFRVLPGKTNWLRVPRKPVLSEIREDGAQSKFIVSFKHKLKDGAITYFAFTYPFSCGDLEHFLHEVRSNTNTFPADNYERDEIYYHREILCYSYEGRPVEVVTISSHHGITNERELRLQNLFPDLSTPRSFKFCKDVIFLTARVHPGETPSAYVMNGMISFLVEQNHPVARELRKYFVFKLIPMLNPDGVYRGNYRLDGRGVNLNRVYLAPSLVTHPTIYGVRKLILYYHSGVDLESSMMDTSATSREEYLNLNATMPVDKSGLYMYIDMHAHRTKKGIFMYGNCLENVDDMVECMLFPKVISINSQHFNFESCNFSKAMMSVKDKDGSGREGSGRVAVHMLTGLARSYTLECNFNTGNILNPFIPAKNPDEFDSEELYSSPEYTPQIFAEVGKSILSSILDIRHLHPNSRLSNTPYGNIENLKDEIKDFIIRQTTEIETEKDRANRGNKATYVPRSIEACDQSSSLANRSTDHNSNADCQGTVVQGRTSFQTNKEPMPSEQANNNNCELSDNADNNTGKRYKAVSISDQTSRSRSTKDEELTIPFLSQTNECALTDIESGDRPCDIDQTITTKPKQDSILSNNSRDSSQIDQEVKPAHQTNINECALSGNKCRGPCNLDQNIEPTSKQDCILANESRGSKSTLTDCEPATSLPTNTHECVLSDNDEGHSLYNTESKLGRTSKPDSIVSNKSKGSSQIDEEVGPSHQTNSNACALSGSKSHGPCILDQNIEPTSKQGSILSNESRVSSQTDQQVKPAHHNNNECAISDNKSKLHENIEATSKQVSILANESRRSKSTQTDCKPMSTLPTNTDECAPLDHKKLDSGPSNKSRNHRSSQIDNTLTDNDSGHSPSGMDQNIDLTSKPGNRQEKDRKTVPPIQPCKSEQSDQSNRRVNNQTEATMDHEGITAPLATSDRLNQTEKTSQRISTYDVIYPAPTQHPNIRKSLRDSIIKKIHRLHKENLLNFNPNTERLTATSTPNAEKPLFTLNELELICEHLLAEREITRRTQLDQEKNNE